VLPYGSAAVPPFELQHRSTDLTFFFGESNAEVVELVDTPS